jgi:hypothetical protein
LKREVGNSGKEKSHEGEDESESRKRTVGQLNPRDGSRDEFMKGEKAMKVRTKVKAGGAVWGT